MSNYFLKVDKDLLGKGLTPIEILIVAQIAEFQTNTGDCFISDKALADNYGVSESTISRAIKALEAKGIVKRTTKNVRGGKERHLEVSLQQLTSGKMTVENTLQASNCSLTTSKMTVDNKQNDLIKDNIKDKGKDNKGVDKTASLRSAVIINSSDSQKEEVTEIAAYKLRAMGARYEFISNDLVRICDTGKVFKVYGY